MERSVDIIIPIYNGYDDIIRCMDSVVRYTDLSLHRVILINDKSPDERILPLLQSMCRDGVVLLDNEKNQGFSANVNKGMLYSEDRDVILLNSDTQVTRGWVEKLIRCAYSRREIASVTPMSNAATLCSYPVMCVDNKLPAGMTVDELGELVERVSEHRYPQITVAVGFCMYIKREVIQRVGLFDAETFGRGYGEENDFCNRAEQYGYTHVMCDDTFIYHYGTASFQPEEKKRLIEAHDAILNQRYPLQMRRNHLYCVNNPDQDVRDRIDVFRLLNNGRKTVLYFSHADFREDASNYVGGTQFHIKDLTKGLCHLQNVIVAARDERNLRVTVYIDDLHLDFKFFIGEKPEFQQFTNERLAGLIRRILRGFAVDLVHVHQIYGLSFDIFYETKALGIPLIVTLHDYYMVCPTIKMVNADGKYCARQEGCGLDCDTCLQQQGIVAETVAYADFWREQVTKALSLCDKLIFPSESARQVFVSNYPALNVPMQVIYHGLDLSMRNAAGNQYRPQEAAPAGDRFTAFLDNCFDENAGRDRVSGWAIMPEHDCAEYEVYVRVSNEEGESDYYKASREPRTDVMALYGYDERYRASGFYVQIPQARYEGQRVTVSVGMDYQGVYYNDAAQSEVVVQATSAHKGGLRVAFIGGMVPEKGSKLAKALVKCRLSKIDWYVFGIIGDAELNALNDPHLIKVGPYAREQLPMLLRQNEIDVICILSTWPETFCYTLSEAFLAGIPVIGIDVGAVGERLRKNGAGWLVSNDNTFEEVRALVQRLRDDPLEIRAKRAVVEANPDVSLQEMLSGYEELYASYPRADHADDFTEYDVLLQGLSTVAASKTKQNPYVHSTDDLKRRLMETEARLAEQQAFTYRVVNSGSYRLSKKIARVVHLFRRMFGKCG